MKLHEIVLPNGVSAVKAMKYISAAAQQYGFDWDGVLWRHGDLAGNFWHISRKAVEYYEAAGDLHSQNFPKHLKNVLLLNIVSPAGVELLENIIYLARGITPQDLRLSGEWTYQLAQSLPFLRQHGYDGLVVVGASGVETPPPQVEVILL